MKIKFVVFPPLFLCLFSAAVARADVIESKNGHIIEGNIIQETNKGYVMDIPGVGQLTVSKSEVKSVKRAAGNAASGPPASSIERSAERSALRFDDRKWRLGFTTHNDRERIEGFVLEGESVENWSELITTQIFPGLETNPSNVGGMVDTTKEMLLKRCPSLKFKEISRTVEDVLYEWEVSGCSGIDNQTEIARVILGKDGLHVVHYAVKKVGLTGPEKEKWRSLLKKTTLHGEPVESLVDETVKKV